ncbi:uncharacterized protein [Haliotis cracherodii]|uniref:uncharacterized protein n=1 Tax=Haliotis cracherodii TaxID=6455 RepID=UPI0039E884C0
MATAKKLTDNHLTCVICSEVFTDPVTLQCNHTFCKSCFLKYTKTQPEAIQAKSIPCPSCRQLTKVTNPDSPVEKWVSQLKPSHVIQGLMDDLGESSDTCSVCKVDGETTPGTVWCTICDDVFCDGCLQLHKKMPLSRDHEVIDLRIHSNRKPKVQRFMCRIHKDEKIKLFCKDCRMAICTVCCSIKHRKCDDVATIDTMTPLVKESLITETRNDEKKIETYTKTISSTNSKLEKLSTNAQEMKDQVQKVRKAAVDVLLKKEKKLLDRIDQLTETRVHELKDHRKSQEIDLQMHQQRHEFIDKVVTSHCVADMYDIYETMTVAPRDKDTSEDKRPIPSTIVFTHDTDKLRRYVDEVQLGEVKVFGGLYDRTSSPVLLQTIDWSRQGDIGPSARVCFDVAVLVVDDIKVTVVTGNASSRLHACYTSNTTFIQKCLQLPTGPRRLAKVGGAQAAVTLPDTRQIAFINFDPEPSLLSTVKTKRKYYGLACLNSSQLVAGGYDSLASVDVLDMKGNVLKSINTGVIKNPFYIHVTRNNNLIFSDVAVKSLVSVTSDGEVVFTYTPTGDRALEFPRGVTTTSTGDILLVDRGANRVIQLTESGQFVRNVLTQHDGLMRPRGICLDDDGLLYVTSDEHVKIFTFTLGEREKVVNFDSLLDFVKKETRKARAPMFGQEALRKEENTGKCKMATAKKLTDNHLSCVICTEVFTDPATLQCNHTFCKSCLLKYTKTQPEAIQAKSIPCPSCRQLTKVSNPGSPVVEWVSQLKPSHVIQGLMDDFGNFETFSCCALCLDTCSVCKEDGETTPGTVWCTICDDVFCDGCLKLHKKMPLSRDHEVIDLRIHSNRKPKVQRFMCRIHKDEKIKLFCKDCRTAICTVCCSIKHRKCDDVETIDTMTPLVKESLITETRNHEKKIKTYTDNISSTNSKIEKLSTNAQEMKDQVQKVRMAAVDVLLRKEKKLLDRIDKLTETRVEELKGYIMSQEIELQMHQQRHEFIDKAVTSHCVADMYDIYQTLVVAPRDKNTSEDKRPIPSTIFFTHDTDKLRRSVDEVQLGEVKVVGGLYDWTSSPFLLQTIDCSRQENTLTFLDSLFDVSVLVVDGIKVTAVIDMFNSRLHACYTSNTTLIQKCLQLPTRPRRLAKVGGAQAAVTLPASRQIAFINFDPEPKLLSTVKTKRKYYGLACLNSSQLVAGGDDSRASVDVLDMKGNVLKSINTGVIKDPSYIHVTRNNNLIVSVEEVKSLVSVTSDGEVVFTYTPTGDKALACPSGVTTTSTGDILLVDRETNRVIQLTESGQFVRDVLTQHDGLKYPRGICVDDDGLLYVTNYDHVKVFTF